MAQSDFAEEINIDDLQIEHTDVMTGDKDKSRFLYYQLKMSMLKADRIDIIVSFLMESGVRMILEDLRNALNRGVQVRILTGNYLGITQPSALCLIKKELGDRVDLRFYNDKGRSFHQARRHIPMTMEDWKNKLDAFLRFNDAEVLQDKGKVTFAIAKEFAESEFEKYRIVQDKLYRSDFD